MENHNFTPHLNDNIHTHTARVHEIDAAHLRSDRMPSRVKHNASQLDCYYIHEPSYSFMLLYHWHRITETHTFNESNGVFLNELNLSWFFGYFSKYAIRIASPESIAFAAGMLHVDWIIAICSGVNDVIIGITVDFFWQDAITPMFMVCFFCFFWTQLRLRRYYLGGVFLYFWCYL